jgi:hypothetical protein
VRRKPEVTPFLNTLLGTGIAIGKVLAPISAKSFAPNATAGCAKAGSGAKRCSEEEVHLVARVPAYRTIGV